RRRVRTEALDGPMARVAAKVRGTLPRIAPVRPVLHPCRRATQGVRANWPGTRLAPATSTPPGRAMPARRAELCTGVAVAARPALERVVAWPALELPVAARWALELSVAARLALEIWRAARRALELSVAARP